MKRKRLDALETPDIDFTAYVKARELCFEEVPDPEVRFWGDTERNSISGTERKNLPQRVWEDVTYRDASVRLQIASEIVDSDPDLQNSSGKERVKTNLEYRGRKTGEQETESKEEKG